MRKVGLEPTRPFEHWNLNPARLPFRHSRNSLNSLTNFCCGKFPTLLLHFCFIYNTGNEGETLQNQLFELSEKARKTVLNQGASVEVAISQALDEAFELEPELLEHQREALLRTEVEQQLVGFGKLQPLLDDPEIEEIWINSTDGVFIAKAGISQKLDLEIPELVLRSLMDRMLRNTGRRLDRSSPFVDASLPDGSRLHVVIPDITKMFWSVNIRKFPSRITTLEDLVAMGSINERQMQYLVEAVTAGKNILVSGATQAGKTTLLCALLGAIDNMQRIISVEETFEIRTLSDDWVAMQTRQPNLEGTGEVTLRRLIKEALRMRPARIVVGEVREAESFDLLIALNSGLPGLCTIHANSAEDAISKLMTLPLLAGPNIHSDFVNPTVGRCIDVVVHCELQASGNRRVRQIIEVDWDADNSRIVFEEALPRK